MTDYCVLSELFELIWPELNLRDLVGRDFFLPLKGFKDVSPSTISRWICDVIKLVYADLSSSDLSFMKISAHEVRALSSSWAYWNSVALDDVVRAGYWRTKSTFASFILRDLAPIRQGTSSLGPLVAAQSITGGHRSVP